MWRLLEKRVFERISFVLYVLGFILLYSLYIISIDFYVVLYCLKPHKIVPLRLRVYLLQRLLTVLLFFDSFLPPFLVEDLDLDDDLERERDFDDDLL